MTTIITVGNIEALGEIKQVAEKHIATTPGRFEQVVASCRQYFIDTRHLKYCTFRAKHAIGEG